MAPGSRLKFVYPGWFAAVMGLAGLAGLALAWQRAAPTLGPTAQTTSAVLGVLAALVFAVLALAAALRGCRHAQAWREDLPAFSALTLRLAEQAGAAMATVGVASLAASSLVIAALVLATLRGLRDGSLLAPEPVAGLQPASP